MPASRPEDRRFDSSWGSISLEVPLGPPACDAATWPAHHQPLLVVDLCDRGLQVVHGHLPSYLAVDLRDGQHPVEARLGGDGHHAAAEILAGMSVCAKVMMLGKGFSIEEARSKKGPFVLLHVFAIRRRGGYFHITHSLVVSWHVYRCHPVGIPGFDSQ